MGFFLGTPLLVLSILPFSLAANRIKLEKNSKTAIVLSTETTLRSAPDAQSAEILRIHGGLKVKLLDRIGDWEKVRLQNGEEGWLPQNDLEQI